MVTRHDAVRRTLSLSYGVACGTTYNAIVFGALDQVFSYGFTGRACGLGTSGASEWIYPASPVSLFFLIVGNNGSVEGSYGTDSSGRERPPGAADPNCSLPQDLTNRCD